MEKRTTDENIRDLGTKALDERQRSYLVKKLGMTTREASIVSTFSGKVTLCQGASLIVTSVSCHQSISQELSRLHLNIFFLRKSEK